MLRPEAGSFGSVWRVLIVAFSCAALAVAFLLLWLGSRRAVATALADLERERSERRRSDTRLDEMTKHQESLTDELESVRSELVEERDAAEQTRTESTERIERLTETSADQTERLADLADLIAEAETEVERLGSELAASDRAASQLHGELAEQAEQLASQSSSITDLSVQNDRLQADLAEAADRASKRPDVAVPPVLMANDSEGVRRDVPGFSPATAWELELVRSERTWRYSVAANPMEDPSPFANTDNPLRLAVEIEALALREDVGAFIGIDWQIDDEIDPTADPARAHLTLRLAQEMLAAAAREPEPSQLVVRIDEERGGVSLQVLALDAEDVDFKIPPPPIASEWIGIDDHGGMVVTVKTA